MAYETEQKLIDERAWVVGKYTSIAVLWGIDHGFNGSKATVEYPEKPFSQQEHVDEENISDEKMKQNHEALFAMLDMMKVNFELDHPEKKHYPTESEVVTHG